MKYYGDRHRKGDDICDNMVCYYFGGEEKKV